MDTVTRKKNTGEPGNPGQFGSKTHSEGTISLASTHYDPDNIWSLADTHNLVGDERIAVERRLANRLPERNEVSERTIARALEPLVRHHLERAQHLDNRLEDSLGAAVEYSEDTQSFSCFGMGSGYSFTYTRNRDGSTRYTVNGDTYERPEDVSTQHLRAHGIARAFDHLSGAIDESIHHHGKHERAFDTWLKFDELAEAREPEDAKWSRA